MRNQHAPIAAEGVPFILGSFALTALLVLLTLTAHGAFAIPAAIFAILTVFILYFFRNPERTVPSSEKAIVAPADGIVVYRGRAHEPHLGVEMEKVSIFMSVFNVHVNRVPVTGRVVDAFYTRGKFFDVRDERASFENEQKGLIVETASGAKLVVVQVAGLIARRIVCYAKVGDLLERGRRYGLIRFGSRLDIFLPVETNVTVTMGERTVAGETVLGLLP
ncbi:phosphatidylserine decarboxylase family protein [Geomonas sp. RF6]|uniref:phosphatidylserine decarboxylase family protein n=1 Tax=Geomonas sp. RF6 TaxID=2897342 RepID=UPI001E507BCC|nr:phosphatidylserine decarboxylase family protein [Geomonas sp. RF6]UFS68905.1 phosphatidylserine decarboxylase family protein [Geomonas sp. RF6]